MSSIQRLYRQISRLSPAKRAELNELLASAPSPGKAGAQREQGKKAKGPAKLCPHCQSHLFCKFGSYRGQQRFRCGICLKTFTGLTNTPVSKTKYPEKWNRFVACCVEGMSLRKIATKLEINVATAFSWRHKLMATYASQQQLHGIAEADETFFLHSEKGNKSISRTRQPRKRGGKAKTAGISEDQVPVVVGKDREGGIIVGVAGRGRVTAKEIEQVLSEHIDPDATLCTDAHPSFKAYAKANNLKYIQLNVSKGQRVVRKKYHIQNVNGAHSNIKKWMVKFNGVSTKYLQNYMNWYCLLEETKSHENQSHDFAQKTLNRPVIPPATV
jgi:transposase-like protein